MNLRPVSPRRVVARAALCVAPFAASLLATSSAHAQVAEHLFVRGEIAGGEMIANYQQNILNDNVAVEGAGRIGVQIVDQFSLQLSFASWYFPNNTGGGQQYSILGGLRFDLLSVQNIAHVWLDGNIGPGFTPDFNANVRLAFDVGIGLDITPTYPFSFGPFGRYGQLVAQGSDFRSDAQYLVVGLSVTMRPPRHQEAPPPPPPPDTDHDGVLDRDDACPNEPQGDHPDPAHPGCPMRDTDHDGIDDAHDLCPETPAGDHPDPQRLGCPTPDSDHDGVLDPQDQCPTTAAGEHPDPDRPGCPDGDDDGDGVLNHVDQCPHEAPGLHPDPARPGCPMPDRDHDGVPDASDACPDQPGAPSTDARRNGCPGLVRVENGMIVILQPVFFATNRDRILPNSFPVLRAVAEALRAQQEIHRVAIEGHTDNVGDPARNLDLSQRRAASIVAWLTQHGVESGRLEAHGFGDTRPIQPNRTSVGRSANRRVEFRITDPAQPPPSAGAGMGTTAEVVTSSSMVPAAEAPQPTPVHHHHHHHHEP